MIFNFIKIKQTKNERFFGGCTVYFALVHPVYYVAVHLHVAGDKKSFYFNVECGKMKRFGLQINNAGILFSRLMNAYVCLEMAKLTAN